MVSRSRLVYASLQMISCEMRDAKRMRLVCGLRQIDVWAGAGITPGRLSKAENGKLELDGPEMATLGNFLRKQWELCQQDALAVAVTESVKNLSDQLKNIAP